jgi:citrate lyase beta subunit
MRSRFAPADSSRKLEKALTSDADVIIDLEDPVAAEGKAAARQRGSLPARPSTRRSALACWCGQ